MYLSADDLNETDRMKLSLVIQALQYFKSLERLYFEEKQIGLY